MIFMQKVDCQAYSKNRRKSQISELGQIVRVTKRKQQRQKGQIYVQIRFRLQNGKDFYLKSQ